MTLGIKLSDSMKQEYRQKGYWGDATLADYWTMSVLMAPEKEAVVDQQGAKFTFQELDQQASQLAAYLQKNGLKKGDIVSVQLPGWAEFVIIFLACLKTGAIINPLLPNLRESELTFILNKCESKFFFCPSYFKHHDYVSMVKSFSSKIKSLIEIVVVDKEKIHPEGMVTLHEIIHHQSPLSEQVKVDADDVCAILFTSGTEGRPKGVMLTHNNIVASEKALAAALHLTYLDVILMPSPLAHASGFHHGICSGIIFGAKVVLQDIFEPYQCLELIEQEKCTYGFACTTFIYDLLAMLRADQHDISSFRFFLCGGAPIPRQLVKEGLEAGFRILGVYGSTESVPHTCVRIEDSVERIVHSDGCALPGIDIKIVDENRITMPTPGLKGEEASRGPNVFVGYLKEPELTNQVLDDDGWYYSGDFCTMDADGYIRINGRKKDIIIRGGENISSHEMEEILLEHSNIKEVACIGLPDHRLGERACAVIVREDETKTITLKEIQMLFSKKQVSKYKYPERIEFIDKLPRTETGKVKKFLLRESYGTQANEIGKNDS